MLLFNAMNSNCTVRRLYAGDLFLARGGPHKSPITATREWGFVCLFVCFKKKWAIPGLFLFSFVFSINLIINKF